MKNLPHSKFEWGENGYHNGYGVGTGKTGEDTGMGMGMGIGVTCPRTRTLF